MKKTRLLIIPLMVTVIFAGCAKQKANAAPEITGVADGSYTVNSRVDLLKGVAALDKEDGDITPALGIKVYPEVPVSDGYAVFNAAGDYEINYKIEDSGGKKAEKSCILSVYEREVYKSGMLPNGFAAEVNGGAVLEKNEAADGAYTIKVSGAEIAEDAVLTRTYALKSGVLYTFRYSVNSSAAGVVKICADGGQIAETEVAEGDNEIVFTHTPESGSVKTALCFGGLAETVEWRLTGASAEYTQADGGFENLTEGFSFNGKTQDRFDNNGVPVTGAGKVEITNGGASASLEISSVFNDIWRGGMFVNTGVILKAGATYKVCFDAESERENPYEIIIQRSQWDEYKIETLYSPKGSIEREFTADGSAAGELWLYVQSGTQENKITVSNLSVQMKQSGVIKENYRISGFKTSHGGDGSGSFKTENGKVIYTAERFGDTDWNNKLEGPAFDVDGTGLNYIITFKAKASKPVKVVFAAPVYGGWDPVFVWSSFTIGTEEQYYSFVSNSADADRTYQFVWQFGSPQNQKYTFVTVEISDVKICYKSALDLEN